MSDVSASESLVKQILQTVGDPNAANDAEVLERQISALINDFVATRPLASAPPEVWSAYRMRLFKDGISVLVTLATVALSILIVVYLVTK